MDMMLWEMQYPYTISKVSLEKCLMSKLSKDGVIKMKISIKENCNEKVNEKMLLLSIIGSLEAIREAMVSIDEIEKFLFSPRMCRILKEKGYRESILHIIEEGCELEDVASLLPDRLNKVIDDIKKEALLLLSSYDEYNLLAWIEE